MNAVKKIATGVSIIGVLVGLSGFYIIESKKDDIKNQINENINLIKVSLPEKSSIELVTESNTLFSNNLQYKIFIPNKDKNLEANLLLNIEETHDIGVLFGEPIKLNGDLKVEGPIASTFKINSQNKPTQTFSGFFNQDNLELEIIHNNIEVNIPYQYIGGDKEDKESLTINLNGEKDKLILNSLSKEVSYQYSGLNLSLVNKEKPAEQINIKNMVGNYIFNLDKIKANNLYQGVANMSIAEINDGTDQLNIKNIKINTKSETQSDKYSTKLDLSVENANLYEIKDLSLSGKAEVNGLNVKLFNLTNKLKEMKKTDSKLTEQDEVEIKNTLTKTLLDGLTVSVSDLVVKSGTNEANLNFTLKINPVTADNKFSIYKNLSLNAELGVKGEYAQASSAIIGGALGMSTENPETPTEMFSVKINYTDGVLRINEATANTEVRELVSTGLKAGDEILGFEVEEIAPEKAKEQTLTEPEGPKVDETKQSDPTEIKDKM